MPEPHGENLRIAEYNGLLDGLLGMGPGWDVTANATRGEVAQMLWNLLNVLERPQPADSSNLLAAGASRLLGHQAGRVPVGLGGERQRPAGRRQHHRPPLCHPRGDGRRLESGCRRLAPLPGRQDGWLSLGLGQNDHGQLGDGTTTDRHLPTRIGTDTDWKAVAAGELHSLALKRNGSLWTWGLNERGQLGDGSTTDRHDPTRIGTDTDWKAVSAGLWHCVALKVDGSLWAWGDNREGQLGDGSTTERYVPTRIGTDTDWDVFVASFHCLALKTDGSLWAWGRNEDGQVGDGSTTERHLPTRIGTDTDWKAVGSGEHQSFALKDNGSLWTWGWNYYGQLGDGSTTDRHKPTRIGTATNWKAVAAGGWRHSLGLKEDGSLWAWGWNPLWPARRRQYYRPSQAHPGLGGLKRVFSQCLGALAGSLDHRPGGFRPRRS